MTLDEFLDKLEGVRPAGTGYVAVCPAHDDREPSLGVTEGDDGLLITCHAGCASEDVLEAMGLAFSDLFFHSVNYAEPEATYSYRDEFGEELFQAVRFPGKKFRQRHKGPEGEWVYNLDGIERVLYRLPELIAGVRAGKGVWIAEGEKDVEALRAAGKVATCNPMGAGKWRDEYTQNLAGANVTIVADRDEPGRAHAETVKTSLQGVAANLRVVQAARGKDAHDHLVEHGLTPEQFVERREHVRRGVITARQMAEQALEDLELHESDLPGYTLVPEVPLSFRPGRMYAIGAYTGDGKTCFALQGLRTMATLGRRVGYFSLEMPERDLRNRLVAHKGVPLAYSENPWRLKADAALLKTYHEAADEIGRWNADIIFDSNVGAEKVVEITRDREYEIVFVDHLNRFSWGTERRKLEEQVAMLTNMALEQNLMLVLLCQLRKHARGKDFEVYPMPTLQDFRETSVIGDDSSMALAIWRQRDPSGMQYTGSTQVIVLKNRHTTSVTDAAGKFFMPVFDPARQMFTGGLSAN